MASHDPEQTPHVYEFGDFRLDTENTTSYRLMRSGQPCRIQPMPFRLLCLLVKNHGRAISTEELIRHLWSERVIDDSNREYYQDSLHHHIGSLRDKVGKERIPFERKVGYHFAGPVNTVQLPPTPIPVYPDLEFNQWVLYSRECWRIKVFLGAGVLASIVYYVSYLLLRYIYYPALEQHDPRVPLCLIQFVVVGGALIASHSIFDRNVKEFPASPEADAALMKISDYTDPMKWREAKAGAKSSLRQYSRYWKLLLVAWACLYFLLIFTTRLKGMGETLPPQIQNNPTHPFWALSIGTTLFNNFNSLAITLCFVVLNHPTVFKGGEQNTSLERVSRRLKMWGTPAIAAFALVGVLLVVFPPAQWFPPRFPSMTALNNLWALDFISGIVGAITLALFVGRIQSKFLGPSTWLPLALYLYVAIQSLYVTILGGVKWGALIIEEALILKCLLYLYVAWLFKSGRLLFYLVRVKTIYERVNIDWQVFLANLNRER